MDNNNIQQQLYQQQRSNKKYFAIIIVLLLVIGLSVGYAVLTTSFNISGTSIIKEDTKWDVGPKNGNLKDNIKCLNHAVCTIAGSIEEANSLTPDDGTGDGAKGAIFWFDSNTIYFKHLLVKPGDVFSFTVQYENSGTMDAKIDSYSLSSFSGTAASFLDYSITYGPGTVYKNGSQLYADNTDIKNGQDLPAGATAVFKVTITYKDTGTMPSAEQIAAINNVNPQTGKATGTPTAFSVTYKQA